MLRSFRFTGDLYAVPEGTLVFPNEPLLRLEGSIMELQLVETALLNFVGYQSLVATKAARIRHVAPDDVLMEFGSRRARNGCGGIEPGPPISPALTPPAMCGRSIVRHPHPGTHSHSWVQDFDSELGLPRLCPLLSESGMLWWTPAMRCRRAPHAIGGIELKQESGWSTSGWTAATWPICRNARRMLDEAGLTTPDRRLQRLDDDPQPESPREGRSGASAPS